MADIFSANLNSLLALDALIGERSVSAAARRCHVTQSSMSGTLAQLRSLFADPLLVRVGNRMQPTPRALALQAHLRAGVEAFQRVLEPPSGFDPLTSETAFTLAMNDYAELVLLPGLLSALRSAAPGVTLQVLPWGKWTAPRELAEGGIDAMIGFYRNADLPAGHYQRKLFASRFVCIVREGHPRVGKVLSLKTYLELEHVVVTEQPRAEGVVDRVLAARGLRRRIALRVAHFYMVPHVVASTDLVAAVDEPVFDRLSHGLALRALAPPLRFPIGYVGLVWHERTRRDPASRWLRDLIQRIAHDIG